jgi:predicted phosphodiesterase
MQTGFELDRNPGLLLYPSSVQAVVGLVNGDVHRVAPFDDLETAIGHVGGVDGNEDREVLDILHVSVRGAIDVRGETSRAGELVVDFVPRSV